MRTDEEIRKRRQVRQEICNRATCQIKRWVRHIRVGEAIRTENIEADHYLNMGHAPKSKTEMRRRILG